MTSTIAPEVVLAGRYRLVQRLASGGMGQVWRAADEVLGRPVAVKLLRSEYAKDPAFLDRFRTEARCTAALSHPGIANVFDYGEGEGPDPTAYLVMELVEGPPLSSLLAREGRLDAERVLDVIAQAALALGSAHRAGVVHRDVKPSNLLIRRDGVVKVTDFGISRTAGAAPRTETGVVVGTAAYLSPEQVACQPATPASDVYALGVVTYECLAGRRPFTGEHPIALALAHRRHRPPPLPPDVPEPLRALVDLAMAKDPRVRPPDAAALARHVLAARAALVGGRRRGARHAPVATDPEQDTGEWTPVSLLSTRVWSWSRRRPFAVAAMVAVLALLAAALTTAATAQRTPTVTVPSVDGLPIATAGPLLASAGFEVRERAQSDRFAKAGTVLVQDPVAGARLARGSLVTLTVSSGSVGVVVDPARYLGKALDSVRSALIRLGLRVRVETGPADGEPGTVIGINPAGALLQGDAVTITVAQAPSTDPSGAGSGAASTPSGADGDGSGSPGREHTQKVKHGHHGKPD
ncbi:MAG TPA: protein kinase [Actinomycetes bacterium]|jgi:serine/threonine-protein kinase|nr:protein kinase [Actinomycetes bacterium]